MASVRNSLGQTHFQNVELQRLFRSENANCGHTQSPSLSQLLSALAFHLMSVSWGSVLRVVRVSESDGVLWPGCYLRQKPVGGSKAGGLPHPSLSPFPPLPLSIPPKFSDKPVGGKVRYSEGEVTRLPPLQIPPCVSGTQSKQTTVAYLFRSLTTRSATVCSWLRLDAGRTVRVICHFV